MRISSRLAALVALLAALPASTARAQGDSQPADTLPFRAGQWGAEFQIADGIAGVGALRFRSPTSAWLLNLNLGAEWGEQETPAAADDDANSFNVALRAGPRRYRPIARETAAYVGGGVTASYLRSESEALDFNSRGWEAGLYMELGAAYFVTTRLSLGAQAGASATYGDLRSWYDGSPGESRTRRTRISTTPVRIQGALYF